MRTVDLITRKRDGEELSPEELSFLVDGYTRGEIPDYQMAAFLMATFFSGMTDKEVGTMTELMLRSGETLDLSDIPGLKVDKHSTGGVGDKTSLIATPLAAAAGVTVRGALITAQLALSLALLIVSGLFVRAAAAGASSAPGSA